MKNQELKESTIRQLERVSSDWRIMAEEEMMKGNVEQCAFYHYMAQLEELRLNSLKMWLKTMNIKQEIQLPDDAETKIVLEVLLDRIMKLEEAMAKLEIKIKRQ